MLTDAVKAQVADLVAAATDEDNTANRVDFLKRYLGEPYGDEVRGRSAFVDSAAQDAVEAILPEIMDVFTSTPELVEFSPVGSEDEAAALQETQAVSHMFWQKNNGFLILYTWIKEAMIQQNAYVWRGWVEVKRTEIEEWEGLSFQEYEVILEELEGKDFEIVSESGLAVLTDEATGIETTIPDLEAEEESIDLRVRITETSKEYKIEPFPQEDFFGSKRWNSLDLNGIPCCGRRHRDKTADDWRAYGFHKDSVELLSKPSDEEETAARHSTQDSDESDDTGDQLELYEAYLTIDLSGDGAMSLVRVWCNKDGSTIMKWADGSEAIDEVSSLPISALTPYIMPHRHIGQSVVEKVDDLAKVKTVLMRHTLDNIYATNYPRPQFDPDLAGPDAETDLANPDHGAPIRTSAPITWTQPASVVGTTLPMLEKFDTLQEQRTGATRYNQGLDADTLNKTFGGMSMIMTASQKKAKLIARTFAETGLMDLFRGIHADLRKGPVKELMMKLRGQWVAVNPRTWKHRTDMVPNVGMGKGDNEERRMALGMAAQAQEKLMMSGSRLVDESKIYAMADDTLRTFGVETVQKYFNDPSRMPPQQPQPERPDPMLIAAQSQAQKVQTDMQVAIGRMQADEREKERQHQRAMAELQLKEIELTNKIQDQRDRNDLEADKAILRDDLERDKLNVSGTPAVPYDQVTGDTQ